MRRARAGRARAGPPGAGPWRAASCAAGREPEVSPPRGRGRPARPEGDAASWAAAPGWAGSSPSSRRSPDAAPATSSPAVRRGSSRACRRIVDYEARLLRHGRPRRARRQGRGRPRRAAASTRTRRSAGERRRRGRRSAPSPSASSPSAGAPLCRARPCRYELFLDGYFTAARHPPARAAGGPRRRLGRRPQETARPWPSAVALSLRGGELMPRFDGLARPDGSVGICCGSSRDQLGGSGHAVGQGEPRLCAPGARG